MITILGGGIGGLTLAAILTRNGIACIVHDADLTVNSRHQGGMLNINEGPAHDALIAIGVYDAFRSMVLEGGDALKLMNRAGEVLIKRAGDGGRPEIDRGALRELLAASLPDGLVRWNSKVTRIERQDSGHVLTFADGHAETTELLVGADGAWSKVRPLLTDAQPAYCGLTFFEYRYLDSGRAWPLASKLVGDGSLFALAEGRGILAHREPAEELCVYAALMMPEEALPAEASREAIVAEFRGWHPDFLSMLSASDGPLVRRTIYALPMGLTWDRAPGVTLLGDAAHVMSPFAGAGVNLAMEDAADLVKALIANPANPETALAIYESRLFPRSKDVAERSQKGLEMAFTPDAPKPYYDFFSSVGIEGKGE